MKKKLVKFLLYLLKLAVIFLIVALVLFLIMKYVFKVNDDAYFLIFGAGAILVALSTVLGKSKRHRKRYDKDMESFYFEDRKKNF